MSKIYVASSWRNNIQPSVVKSLRDVGHDVYDFKNPAPGDNGFHWSAIDGGWKTWDANKYRRALSHPIAERGFQNDMVALREADATVLVMPCGRSAHLELGYAVGAGQRTFVLLDVDNPIEPELMVKMCTAVCLSLKEVIEHLARSDGSNVARVAE